MEVEDVHSVIFMIYLFEFMALFLLVSLSVGGYMFFKNMMKKRWGKYVRIEDIKIKKCFKKTMPRENKLQQCRDFWNTHHKQDRYIVLDQNGYLIDGYVMYIVLKENNIKKARVKIKESNKLINKEPHPDYRNKRTTYIYGKHKNRLHREYIWRVPASWDLFAKTIQVNDSILCHTVKGVKRITVTKINVLDKCPVNVSVKKVASKEILRNGVIINTSPIN